MDNEKISNGKKEIDCSKITCFDEVRLILDSLNLHMSEDCPHYDKLKHLIK